MGAVYAAWGIYVVAVATNIFVWSHSASYILAARQWGGRASALAPFLWLPTIGTLWLLAWPVVAGADLYRCERHPTVLALLLSSVLAWVVALVIEAAVVRIVILGHLFEARGDWEDAPSKDHVLFEKVVVASLFLVVALTAMTGYALTDGFRALVGGGGTYC